MTTAIPTTWTRAPAAPGAAAPLRAVDEWRAEPVDGGLEITARVRVRGEDPNLRGHFPGLPIFPGVFVVEALCQALRLALADARMTAAGLHVLKSVRFLAPLLDGDRLTLGITAAPRPGGRWNVTAVGRRQDETVTARLRAEFGPRSEDKEDEGTTPAEGITPAGHDVPSAPPRLAPGPPARDHHRIRAVLPQRHPLLLVDQVLEFEPGRSIACVKAVTGTEPSFAALPDGAGPEAYGYPRSLLIESLGQCAALLWLDGRTPEPGADRVLMFVGARDFRFEGDALPGDLLHHRVRLDSVVADTAFATGETWVGDRRIATVSSLVATRRPLALGAPSEPSAHHHGGQR